MSKIQDKQVAKLCSNNIIGVCGSVKVRPTVKGGRLTKVANFTGVIVFESMNI